MGTATAPQHGQIHADLDAIEAADVAFDNACQALDWHDCGVEIIDNSFDYEYGSIRATHSPGCDVVAEGEGRLLIAYDAPELEFDTLDMVTITVSMGDEYHDVEEDVDIHGKIEQVWAHRRDGVWRVQAVVYWYAEIPK